MLSPEDPEPDQSGRDQHNTIYVGQDEAGHWLVQDGSRQLEGRFISFVAAMSYAQAERQVYHAAVELATTPLIPVVPFSPVGSAERVLPWAA